ncbi:MAG: hypothetical protein QOG34_1384 [Frankiaceae bacterium]|jgi:hypothetical protein|nr:hypothetical protein [Frankiaceae bacterium]
MADSGPVHAAQLARSCARFLGRVPLVSRDRLSRVSIDALSQCERAVADLLRQTADVLVDYANGAQGAGTNLATACERFGRDSAELQQGLDADPALGLLPDVFADVVGDAAKLAEPGGGSEDEGGVAVAPPQRPARRSRAASTAATAATTATGRRRRPAWQPPSDVGQSDPG